MGRRLNIYYNRIFISESEPNFDPVSYNGNEPTKNTESDPIRTNRNDSYSSTEDIDTESIVVDKVWEGDQIFSTTQYNLSIEEISVESIEETSENRISQADFITKLFNLRRAIYKFILIDPNTYYININRRNILDESFLKIMEIGHLEMKQYKPFKNFLMRMERIMVA